MKTAQRIDIIVTRNISQITFTSGKEKRSHKFNRTNEHIVRLQRIRYIYYHQSILIHLCQSSCFII